jgi:thiol-disulfide isomerase/thioredoxin
MGTGRLVLYRNVTVGAIVAAAVLVLAAAGGFAWQRRDGRLKQSGSVRWPGAGAERGAGNSRARGRGKQVRQRMTMADLGHPLGARATLLQFSSSFCAPCRAARQLLADVAARTDGVAHLEIDVADRLDLVRRLDVRRTPTVFVLGPQGQITRRASGVPRRDDVLAAVALASSEPSARIGSDSEHGLA